MKASKLRKLRKVPCGYLKCSALIDPTPGTPGTSLSRIDSDTLICWDCGFKEAMQGRSLLALHGDDAFNPSVVLS